MRDLGQSIAVLLQQAFSFSHASIKSADFWNHVQKQGFFYGDYQDDMPSFLHIHAGGTILFTSPLHFHFAAIPCHIFFCVHQGTGALRLENHSLSVCTDEFVLLPPDSDFSFSTASAPFSCRIYIFSGSMPDCHVPGLLLERKFLKGTVGTTDPMLPALFLSIDQQLSAPDESTSLHLSTLFHMLLSILAAAEKQNAGICKLPKHVTQMKRIYDSNYQNPHPLEEMETLIGINRYRLCRDFSDYMGISPLKYLTRVRLSNAKHLLLTTELTVHEIGSLSGMENTNHFINLFKKSTGITPLQFRYRYKV